MKRPNAFSLTELVIVMSAGSAVMMLAVGLIHQAMSLASTANQRGDHQRTLDRVAQQFRQDVHLADQCDAPAAGQIQLTMSDGSTVSYRVSDAGVTRQQTKEDDALRHEDFEFPEGVSIVLETQDEPARGVMTIATHSISPRVAERVDRHVVAVVGRMTAHANAEVSP